MVQRNFLHFIAVNCALTAVLLQPFHAVAQSVPRPPGSEFVVTTVKSFALGKAAKTVGEFCERVMPLFPEVERQKLAELKTRAGSKAFPEVTWAVNKFFFNTADVSYVMEFPQSLEQGAYVKINGQKFEPEDFADFTLFAEKVMAANQMSFWQNLQNWILPQAHAMGLWDFAGIAALIGVFAVGLRWALSSAEVQVNCPSCDRAVTLGEDIRQDIKNIGQDIKDAVNDGSRHVGSELQRAQQGLQDIINRNTPQPPPPATGSGTP